MYKLEGKFSLKHNEYNMTHRVLLDKINYEEKTIIIDGNIYTLEDTDFPTIDKNNPYKLTDEEEKLKNDLVKSFLNSESLQRHVKVFIFSIFIYRLLEKKLDYKYATK